MIDTNPYAVILPTPTKADAGATNALEELRTIKSPVEIPGEWTWLWWTLGALVVVALLTALAAWLYKRREEGEYVSPIPPHVRAMRRLAEALAFLIGEPKLFCIEVSTTVRIYLEEQFRLRAPERTTEEFLHELQASKLLSEAQKQSLGDFLMRCDLVKFARYEPGEPELRDIYNAAVRLVEETTPREAPAPAVASPVAAPPPAPPAPPVPTT